MCGVGLSDNPLQMNRLLNIVTTTHLRLWLRSATHSRWGGSL